MKRLRERNEWKFFAVLARADRGLALIWWMILILRGVLPAMFAIAMGLVVSSVQGGGSLAVPLFFTGVVFLLLQILTPIHQAVGSNLGDRTAAWLYDRLTEACVRPRGMGHLENPKLTTDLTVARDFDLGITGPPLSISMDFIAGGLVEMIGGLTSAAVLAWYRWWAPLVLAGAWLATHWLLRESAVWRDRNTDEVRAAQRDSEYAYRLAVDPPAAKELRLFGMTGWVIERFVARRTRLHELQYEATRLREKSVLSSLLLVVGANVVVFWSLANAALDGGLDLGAAVMFAQCALGTAMIAFGGLNWALDGAAAPVGAVLRLEDAMSAAGALKSGARRADGMPGGSIRCRDVTFAYPGEGAAPVLKGFDLTIPAGSSLAIVGRNGAGKTTLAKLLCRLYDPQSGAIEVDDVDIRDFDLESWRSRVTAVFQDFTPLRVAAARQCRTPGRAGRQGAGCARIGRRRPGSPSSTPCWREATSAGLIYPAGSGNGSRWRGHCAQCNSEPVSYFSTSRPHNLTCAARPRFSIGSLAPRVTAPRFSSLTGSRLSGTPIVSAFSKTER